MAHKKAAGSSRLGRDSESKRLGVKRYGGTRVNAGEVLVRQRGTKYHPGQNMIRGGDDTLVSIIPGVVRFQRMMRRRFTGHLRSAQYVHIEASTSVEAKTPPKSALSGRRGVDQEIHPTSPRASRGVRSSETKQRKELP